MMPFNSEHSSPHLSPLFSPITSHYQLVEVSDKDYICSIDKDNGIHRCRDFPPYKLSEERSCHEPINPSSYIGITSFNDTFNATHCINWNLYYTECKAGQVAL